MIIRENILVFIALIVFSCSSQEKAKLDVRGNWSTGDNKDLFDEYFEIFFSKDKVFSYTSFGVSATPYKMEGNEYFVYNDAQEKFIKKGEIDLYKDTLILRTGGKSLVYLRINKENTLQDLIEQKIDEDTYKNSFNNRLLEW